MVTVAASTVLWKVVPPELVMVKLFMLTDVPVITPPVPALRLRSKELTPSVIPAPKVMAAPVDEPFEVEKVELAVSVTAPV